MSNLIHSLIRISAFLGKEIAEVVRQPRLILSLVLGPFLILLLFGIGYKNEPRAVRTLFVADPDSPLAQQIEENAASISPQLIYSGVVPDEQTALNRLRQGSVDLIAIAPQDAYQTIRNNKQAGFTLYHNEIDPAQAGYIEYLGQIYVDEVNRRVLISMVQEGQTETLDVQAEIKDARSNATRMRQALQTGDVLTARMYQQRLNANVTNLSTVLGASAALLSGVEQNVGSSGENTENQDIIAVLAELQQQTGDSADNPVSQSDTSEEISRLDKVDQDLNQLEERLSEFQRISPDVLVRPFTVETRTISTTQMTAVDFFTPSVIVLLLQHIGVTIAALSIVRERRSGTMELFRVSPVSSLETILGKYLSYLVFGAFLAAILSLLIFYGLRIPMLGAWQDYALVCLALLFTSLGLGFLISLLADTESQAVQLAMITLLLSVFFSGFILDLRYFWEPVRIVSYAIPATYAINLLQNIILRGKDIIPLFMGGLLAIGVVLFITSWLLLRRSMARR